MCEIGPAVEAQQVVANAERDAWQVAFDPDTVFDVEYDAGFERVVFSARVAPVQPASRLALLEHLLRVNFAWRDTGGVRMALDPASNDVVMMFEMPAASLYLARLSMVLGNLAFMHRVWRQVVADPYGTPEGARAWPGAMPAFHGNA
jgi:hypothetical protein